MKSWQIKRSFLVAVLALQCMGFGQGTNQPRSREAVLVESTGPAEVLVLATGIGTAKPNWLGRVDQKKLTASAELDARRAAVWFVLLGGSDPMLTTSQEKEAFEKIAEEFFRADNIQRYIAWEASDFEQRRKIEGGKKLRIKKAFKINKRIIREDLVKQGVLKAREEITDTLGLPFLMVIPEAPKGKAPLDLLSTDPNLKKAAEVIESYLTARRYDVVVPEQGAELEELTLAVQELKGEPEDPAYLLALSIGADIYLTYNVQISSRRIGSRTVKKAVVGVRAFESTTARLLGTETGYSVERPTMDAVVIEEAVNDAVDKVLARINAYWKDDLQQGIRYKLVIQISQEFDQDEAEDIIFQLEDLLGEISNKTKEIALTDYTLDILAWCAPEKYSKATSLYRDLKRAVRRKISGVRLVRTSLNKKLLLLKMTPA